MTLAFTPNGFGNGVLPGSAAVAYTCNTPTSKSIVKEFFFCSFANGPVNLFVCAVPIGGNAGQNNSLLWGTPLLANSSLPLAVSTVLNQGDTIQHWASVASVVSFRYSGVEGQ